MISTLCLGGGCALALLAVVTGASRVHAEPLYLASLAVVAMAAAAVFSFAG